VITPEYLRRAFNRAIVIVALTCYWLRTIVADIVMTVKPFEGKSAALKEF